MWGLQQAVEALRSLASCPWETWPGRWRTPATEPALPLARGPMVEPAPPRSAAGRTDLPLLGEWPWRLPESWSADPVSCFDFGEGPSRRVRARPDVPGADLLRCWVQGRGGDLLHAARWAANGDPAAADFVEAWLDDFLRRCPPGRGPQWASAMEVALRALRLLEAAALVGGADAPAPRRELFDRLLGRHEAWLQGHTDWRAHLTGNHFLVATAGRFLLAAHLRPSPRREREARRAFTLFWREWRRQVLPDGLHFESATHYHLLALDAALRVFAGGLSLGLEPSRAARRRLVDAVGAVLALARPDGSVAAIGDSDDGAFLEPEACALEDVRPLLERASALLGTPTEPSLAPACFPHAGLAVLALGGTRPVHVTVSATPRGRAGTGGHGHDDCGSYEYWAGGAPLVVDRGTGSYTGDPALRERLRSSASHSVLSADGRTQNPPVAGRPFRRRERARPVMTAFDDRAGGAVEVGHHAFCGWGGALTILRRLVLRADGILEVSDELAGSGRHDLQLRVHWAPGLEPQPAVTIGAMQEVLVRRGGRPFVRLRFGRPGLKVSEEPRVSDEPVEHSRRQGRVEPAQASLAELSAEPPVVLRHVLGRTDAPWEACDMLADEVVCRP